MRTQEEIVEMCRAEEHADPVFGIFTTEILIPYLDGEHAKNPYPEDEKSKITFLRKNVKPEAWNKEVHHSHKTDEDVLEEMKAYMGFAWEKVTNHRGISAIRSVTKMRAWLWLLGDDELYELATREDNYTNYGAPILLKICEKYMFDVPDSREVVNMAAGRKCRGDCSDGCS
jgi:hypothetical protein